MAGKPHLVPLLTASRVAVIHPDQGVPHPHPDEPTLVADALYLCNPVPPEPFSEASAIHLATSRLRHYPCSVRFRVVTMWNGRFAAVRISAYTHADGCDTALPPDEGTLLWSCVASPAVTVEELLENYRYRVYQPDTTAPRAPVSAAWLKALPAPDLPAANVYRLERAYTFPGQAVPSAYIRIEVGRGVFSCDSVREASVRGRGALVMGWSPEIEFELEKVGVVV